MLGLIELLLPCAFVSPSRAPLKQQDHKEIAGALDPCSIILQSIREGRLQMEETGYTKGGVNHGAL